MQYGSPAGARFKLGDLVLIRRLQGGRPCRDRFIILSAGVIGGDGCHYYHVQPVRGGRDQVVHQTELAPVEVD